MLLWKNVRDATLSVLSNLEKKAAKKSPTAPFTTSTLQQEASTKIRFFGKSNYDGCSKII